LEGTKSAGLKTCSDTNLASNQLEKHWGAPSFRVLCERGELDDATAGSGLVLGIPTLPKTGEGWGHPLTLLSGVAASVCEVVTESKDLLFVRAKMNVERQSHDAARTARTP